MRRASRQCSQAGFTLLEAIVAIALMGIIMGALATVTAQWLPNWNRGLVRVQRNEQAAVALERLVADLSAAEYVSPNREVVQPLFDGAELSVTFVRTAVGPNTRPGLDIVRIAEMADATGRLLVRTRAPFAPFQIGERSFDRVVFSDPVVLLRAPLRVTFAYIGELGGWTNTWPASGSLPTAIRFTVRDGAAGRILAVSTATRIHVNFQAPRSFEEAPDSRARQARDRRG